LFGVERKWDFEGGRTVVDPIRTWTMQHGIPDPSDLRPPVVRAAR